MSIAKYKQAIAHADTKIFNNGAGGIPDQFEILETEAGSRTVTGVTINITSSRSTGEVVNTGDVVKYVNLFLEVSPRGNVGDAQDRTGWMEWAFVCVKESETDVPITQMGVQTLGVVCNNMFRNECIFSGAMPIGTTQPNYMEMKIKIPRFKQRIHIGDEWRFITSFRSNSSTSVSTTALRVVKSFMYKAYS